MSAADSIDALVDLCPRLFRGQHPRAASSLPEARIKLASRLFNDLDQMLDDDSAPQFEVRQIKEQFGRLRVYFWLDPPYAEGDEVSQPALTSMREKISNRIRAAGR